MNEMTENELFRLRAWDADPVEIEEIGVDYAKRINHENRLRARARAEKKAKEERKGYPAADSYKASEDRERETDGVVLSPEELKKVRALLTS